ncbi:MAG: hypothetical protein MK108_10275 [Mariniblastus sp.]|nr:hypothetical protein [Mariniblastus sp.]
MSPLKMTQAVRLPCRIVGYVVAYSAFISGCALLAALSYQRAWDRALGA